MVGLVGIIVIYVFWFGRERLVDDFIIVNVKGCMIVVYGGCFDWINVVVVFFDLFEVLISVVENKDIE